MLNQIKAFLGRDWTDTLEAIRSSLKSDIDLLDSTNSALLSNGGKQLRPMISLLVARACSNGPIPSDSIHFAAATELLHNATLLHDDVVDRSTLRRGVPTVMSILGGPASVLLGDYWLVKAMDNILSSESYGHTAIRVFSKTLGDLAEGEMLQLQKASSCDTTEEDYLRIIYSKTASLFEASGVSAAISVEADEEITSAVREYCVDLGLAFQIKDDIFDYSDSTELGKPVGSDLDEQKITLPLIGALNNVSPEEGGRVRNMVREIGSHPEFKAAIRDFVFQHGGIGYANARLEEFARKAGEALEVLPDSPEKGYLKWIADFIVNRTK